MAYTNPPDFTNNTSITSAELNTYVRDNLESLRDHGDLMVVLRHEAAQGIANGATAAISWTTAERNQGSLWASATADRIYLRETGRWRIWGTIGFSNNTSAGSRWVYYRMNGTGNNQELHGQAGDANPSASVGILPHYWNFGVDHHTSSTGQYLQFLVSQNSGTTMSLTGTAGTTIIATRVGVRWLGEWVTAT